MKTVIKDALTDEFYCVKMTATDKQGNKQAGPNDFPFWSKNAKHAYPFTSAFQAAREMEFNDLTCDCTRKPVITTIN